jgi:hypothetical protein
MEGDADPSGYQVETKEDLSANRDQREAMEVIVIKMGAK